MSWFAHSREACVLEHTSLDRDSWQLVIDALDGDDSKRDQAFDALNRAALPTWLEQQP